MWYRIFASSGLEPSPSALTEHLHAQGFAVRSQFRGDDLGWTGCEFSLDPAETPVLMERFLPGEDDLREDLNTWAAWVESQDFEPRRFELMERIIQTQQLFTLRKPIDAADEARLDRFCLEVAQWLARQAAGVLQVDGRGFCNAAGETLLEEY